MRRVGHFQALKCRGQSARYDCEQYLAFSPCLAHCRESKGLWLWTVRFSWLAEQWWSFRLFLAHCYVGSALCRAAPRFASFRNPLSHASYASHTSHLQPASREAPRFANRFSGSIQSAKPLYGRKNAPALDRRDGDLPPARKLADGRDLPPAQVKWGCALRVVKRRPLFNDSVVKDQARQPEGLGRIPGVEVTIRLAGITCPLKS